MDRRRVLTGVAIAAFGAAQAAPASAKRRGRDKPLLLTSNAVSVRFDAQSGQPKSYSVGGHEILGGSGAPVEAIVCRLAPRSYFSAPAEVGAAKRGPDSLSFPCQLRKDGAVVAAFTLKYALQDAGLVLTLEDVVETPGFELIEIPLPSLVQMAEHQPGAWFAEGRNGGSFVWLARARNHREDDDDNFGRVSIQLPVGMVGTDAVGCVLEVTAYMDGTETEVSGAPGARRARLGTTQSWRVHGGRCYSANDGEDPVWGVATTPNLLVGQTPRCRLDFFACAGLDQPWLIGAKILAERTPRAPTSYYSDKLLYIIAGKNKTEAAPRTTFAQSRQLIQDVAALTDGAPQINYISGWVYDGQDTGYPSEDKVNASLGTYEELCGLIEAGRRWNANVTLNVNYDDAYKSSPLFDEAFIARRVDGKIWSSRAWDGEMSYIVGMAKFMQGGWGSRRIKYTVDHYPIRDALLVDAMSWFAIRNDWDPAHPASGYKNLVDGKFRLLREAKALGIDIASEQLRYPFIGKMARAMNGPVSSACPWGGDAIPLAATVYRRAAVWGNNGDAGANPGPDLFWNNRPALWFQADSDRKTLTDFYFLTVLPHTKLHDLPVEDYQHVGRERRLILAEQSQIVLNDAADTVYSATWRGKTIAANGATTCPMDDNRIAFYAKTAGTLRYPLPDGWSAEAVVARALTLQGRTEARVRVAGGQIEVDAPSRQAVIVYRTATAALA